MLYKISDFKNTTEFLCNLAQAKGKIKKVKTLSLKSTFKNTHVFFYKLQGGAPNLDTAARMVIQDWNAGKIKYFTIPPIHVTH